jgi:bacillaene synthase trans-acting acyltransferase
MSKTVFMFSGQGSQYYQMGDSLYQTNQTFQEWIGYGDEITRHLLDVSISDVLYNGSHLKQDLFDEILYTHPAIFIIQYALAKTLIKEGIHPDFFLGISLGEITAMALAETMSFEQALSVVIAQAKCLKNYSLKGQMLAVLDAPDHHQKIPYGIELAGINFSNHFVVSGKAYDIEKFMKTLSEKNIISQKLPVAYPFHSKIIDTAKSSFLAKTKAIQFQKPKIPIVSSMTTKEITEVSVEDLWQSIRAPMRFQKTLINLESQGTFNYIDVGPSGTLANFVKHQLSLTSNSRQQAVMTPIKTNLKVHV